MYAPPALVYAEEQALADDVRSVSASDVRSDADTPAAPERAQTVAPAPAGTVPICGCGCGKPLSVSEISGRRKIKRGHKEPTP
jgi:hypothetical protein